MAVVIGIGGLVFLVVALVLVLAAGSIGFSANRSILRTPLLSIDKIAARRDHDRAVAVQGRVVCDAPLSAPLEQTPCVAFRVEIHCPGVVITRSKLAPFSIDDGTGRIAVDPLGGIDQDGPQDPDNPYDPEDQQSADGAPTLEGEHVALCSLAVPETGDVTIGGYSLQTLLAAHGYDLNNFRNAPAADTPAPLALPVIAAPPPDRAGGDDAARDAMISAVEDDSDEGYGIRCLQSIIPVEGKLYVSGRVHRHRGGPTLGSAAGTELTISAKDRRALMTGNLFTALLALLIAAAFAAGGTAALWLALSGRV